MPATRSKQERASNLTSDLSPAAHVGFETEMTARLCPYLRGCPARDVDLQRGDGNVGGFRHDIEHDAISTDAFAISRAPRPCN